ncbi:unnamed protein product [Ectocarpus sp. 4 AP-2014]
MERHVRGFLDYYNVHPRDMYRARGLPDTRVVADEKPKLMVGSLHAPPGGQVGVRRAKAVGGCQHKTGLEDGFRSTERAVAFPCSTVFPRDRTNDPVLLRHQLAE